MEQLVVDRDETLDGSCAATATFSADRTYRYTLTRRWSPGPRVVWVMLNPSTAGAFMLDNTIRRCIGYAQRWQAGGIIVVNLFALRATNPEALRNHLDPVGPYNDQAIVEQLTSEPLGPVVTGWGNNAAWRNLHGRADHVVDLMRQLGIRPMCLSVSKGGHPRHPLYLPGDLTPIPLPRTERRP